MTEYVVEGQPDFLERQAKAQPIVAVAELIWNGLDADATEITVDLEDDQLGGLRRIVVTDNGHGIPIADAPTLFRKLGGAEGRSTPASQPPASLLTLRTAVRRIMLERWRRRVNEGLTQAEVERVSL